MRPAAGSASGTGDVLAERLTTTRGALYKTVHEARRKLRATLAAEGFERGGGGDNR